MFEKIPGNAAEGFKEYSRRFQEMRSLLNQSKPRFT